MAFFTVKKNKKWIIKALDRHTRRTVAWVVSGRNATTARKLYNKLSHLKDCTFYTDDWDAFTKVLPRDRHIIGKKHTISIEQDNSNTRHHLGRMTRRTKIVSRSEEMIYLSMTLWHALNTPEIFLITMSLEINGISPVLSRVLMYSRKPWLKFYPDSVSDNVDVPFDSIGEAFTESCRRFSDKTAMNFLGKKFSYKKYQELAGKFAGTLDTIGLEDGSIIAIQLPNIPQYLFALFGSFLKGYKISGISPLATEDELKRQLNYLQPAVLITFDQAFDKAVKYILPDLPTIIRVFITRPLDFAPSHIRFFARLLKKIPVPEIDFSQDVRIFDFKKSIQDSKQPEKIIIPDRDDIAAIQFTGGTTGSPKGALLSHYNILVNIYQGKSFLQPEYGTETGVSVFPFFHTAGLTGAINTPLIGGCWILIPNPRDIKFLVSMIKKHRPSLLFCVPVLFQKLAATPAFQKLNFSRLKYALSGAAPYPAAYLPKLEKIIGQGKLLEGYGMTEASPGITCAPPGRPKSGTVGLPLPATEIRILKLDESNLVAKSDEPGLLIVRGPQVMQGYLKEENLEIFTDFEGKKWLNTGDIASIDSEGYITIHDRVKDMIIVKGYNVFSLELEECAMEHETVMHAAAIAIPDEKYESSERIKLLVVLNPGFSREESEPQIWKHLQKKLSEYKVPSVLEILTELPLTPLNKVDKKVLRS